VNWKERKRLKEQREAKIEEMRSLIRTADNENRDLTQDETRSFDAAKAESERIRDRLDDEEDEFCDGSGDNPQTPGREDYDPRGPGSHWGGDNNETRALRDDESAVDFLGHRSETHSLNGLSLDGFLRGAVAGPRSDVERRALGEASDSTGGYTVPTRLSAQLIDRLRDVSAVNQAGVRTGLLTSDRHRFARVDADPVATWRTENSEVTPSDPSFSQLEFQPRSLAVLVKVSRELLEDSVNVEQALSELLSSAISQEIDRVALFGSGTAPEPLGLTGTPSINEVAVDGPLSSYEPMIQASEKILSGNAPSPTAAILAPREWATITGFVDANNQPLNMPQGPTGIKQIVASKVPTDGGTNSDESSIILGNFRHLWLGVRTDIRVEVLRDRFAENLQYGFMAHIRLDVQAEYPGAFTKLTGIQPAA